MTKAPENNYFLYKDGECVGQATTYEKLGFLLGLSSTTMRKIHLGGKPDYGYSVQVKKTKKQLRLEEEREFIMSKPEMKALDLADLLVRKYGHERFFAQKKVSRVRNEEQQKKKKKEEAQIREEAKTREEKPQKKNYKIEKMPLCSNDPYGRMVWRISERVVNNARTYSNR